jgi:TolA-binding protein
MECKLCEDKLLEYLYGELSEEDATTMVEHLEASEECREAAKSFRSVLDTVTGVEEEAPPSLLHTRIMGHAEEAGSAKRSFRAWMFRPAVTTAVIGAITAGVYYTTIKYRMPSFRHERIVSEESPLAKSKQRRARSPSTIEVDSPKKEAKGQSFRVRSSESYGFIEQEEAGPGQREALEKATDPVLTLPDELQEPTLAEDLMDEERVYRMAEEKVESAPSPVPHAVLGKADSARRPARKNQVLPGSAPLSSLRDLASFKARVPEPIVVALDLASEGQCSEAEQRIQAFATEYPEQSACGTGWLEVARCFLKKGDTEKAREAAKKALEIESSAKEAQAFLESLPTPTE